MFGASRKIQFRDNHDNREVVTDTIWTPQIGEGPSPKFRALADAIGRAVAAGELGPGDQLPPVRDLAWRLKISPGAVARGYKLAIERGHLSAGVGRGTFVRAPDSPTHPLTLREPGPEPATPAPPHAPWLEMANNCVADVGQDAEIRRALLKLAADPASNLRFTPYGGRDWDFTEREVYAGWIESVIGLKTDADRLLITAGAQQGAHIALRVAAPAHSSVALTGALGHPGFIELAALMGMRLEPVAMDDEGIIPEALDEACRRHSPDAIILTPTHHNPTASVMPMRRRVEITVIARARGIAIIEDDVYGWLDRSRIPRFAELYPEGAYYIAGVSKCLAGGLRIGALVAPKHKIAAAARCLRVLNYHTPALTTALMAELIQSGAAERILETVRLEIAARAALARSYLGDWRLRAPDAAGFGWLPLGAEWRTNDFGVRALNAGVRVATDESCYLLRQAPAGTPRGVRLAFGPAPDREALAQGLLRLRAILQEGPAATPMIS